MTRDRQTSGFRLPGRPPPEGDALDVSVYYLDFYVQDYSRARLAAKRRAQSVVLSTAAANGLIAITGVVITIAKVSWLGLGSVAITGVIGVLAAWDGLYRHRELWIQRSMLVSQLHTLQRNVEVRRARGDDRGDIARDCMQTLDTILNEGVSAWAQIRNTNPPELREATKI